MKKWILLSSFLLITGFAWSQRGYYTMNDTMRSGVKMIDGGAKLNAERCQVKTADRVIVYTPEEVSEYGFQEGKAYVSKKIPSGDSSRYVFLLRLVKDQTSLYHYRGKRIKTYYIEKDTNLLEELTKKRDQSEISYESSLLEFTSDCPEMADAVRLAGYRMKPLTELVNRYNRCESGPFPVLKFGIVAGYEASKLNPHKMYPDPLNQMEFGYDGGYMIGLFLDKPVAFSDFSIHTEILYSSHGFSGYLSTQDKDYDFVANYSVLEWPLMVRYSYPSARVRPFINAGTLLCYNFMMDDLFLETTFHQDVIEINDIKSYPLIAEFQAGYTLGVGVGFRINYKYSAFLDLRFSNLFELSEYNTMNNSVIQCFTGINF